jgi:DNA-directed RNA polymerase specialized sigma subunit
MVWFKKSWEWLKNNWKYVVTFGLPVIVTTLLSLLRSNQSLRKKVELKENEKQIEKEAQDLQERMLREANEDLHDRTKDAFDDWTEDLEEIQDSRRETEHKIDTAEKATAAIKEKLNETD